MLGSAVLDATLAGVLGLLIGSFLNVVIYRLPKMLERQWAAECASLAGKDVAPDEPPFNLVRPRSRCPHCGHAIRWTENIPLCSVLPSCVASAQPARHAIGLRYPAVEAATALLFAWCAWRWGWTPKALAWAGFSAALVALALIDWDTTLLPDDITLPFAVGWSDRISAAMDGQCPVGFMTLWGAVAGYYVVVAGVLGLQAGHRQGRHGLRRLQAFCSTGRLVWLAGAGAR
jgi:leader peptidase (prepilin peptidase)/N-methyltransferase